MFYILAVLFIKILLLSMLMRIFHPVRKKMGLFIRAFIVFLILYYVASLFVRLFSCSPVSAFWNGGGQCVDLDAVFLIDTFVSLVTDAIILILPIFLVSTLHMPLKRKIKVGAILSAGGVATVTNIYRVVVKGQRVV